MRTCDDLFMICLGGGHRLELKDVNGENLLKLRGAKSFSEGDQNVPIQLHVHVP